MHAPAGRYTAIRADRLSNTFGKGIRTDAKTRLPRDHDGWDIACPVGTPVHAVTHGVVYRTSENHGDYGKTIILSINHHGEELYLLYAHLSEISVTKGQFVAEGEEIGKSGRSGNASKVPASESHLHFEVRRHPFSGAIDPVHLLGPRAVVATIMKELAPVFKALR